MGFFQDSFEVQDLKTQIRALQQSNDDYAESAANWSYINNQLTERVRRMAELRNLDGLDEIAQKLAKDIDDAYVRSYNSVEQRRTFIAEKIKRILTEQVKGTPEWSEYMDKVTMTL